MISEKLQDAINEQIKFEIYSGLIYKAMAAYFEAEDLPGFANWMQVQYQEELAHSDKLFRYLCDAGGRVEMRAIDAPRNDYASPLEVYQYALEHEQLVTARFNGLMDLAKQENDHAAQICLQWFVTEQVEEEANFGLIVKKLQLVEGDGRGLLMLDQELAQRVFTPPV